jgi:hypothetical protein
MSDRRMFTLTWNQHPNRTGDSYQEGSKHGDRNTGIGTEDICGEICQVEHSLKAFSDCWYEYCQKQYVDQHFSGEQEAYLY